MIYVLEPSQFDRVRPLFDEHHLRLVVNGVIAGNSPGMIWVDDVEHPHTALMWDKAYCCYLAGAADNAAFTPILRDFVTDTLLPDSHPHNGGIVKLDYASGWEAIAPDIFSPIEFVKWDRHFYAFQQSEVQAHGTVPEGHHILPIDASLLADKRQNISEIIEEIELCWNSVDLFLKNGFGFCLCSDEAALCWCTAEYVSAGVCGIGIATDENHRRRGFATLTASAFVTHCLTHGITPHWDCWKGNQPSVAVAQKVGFHLLDEYAVYLTKPPQS